MSAEQKSSGVKVFSLFTLHLLSRIRAVALFFVGVGVLVRVRGTYTPRGCTARMATRLPCARACPCRRMHHVSLGGLFPQVARPSWGACALQCGDGACTRARQECRAMPKQCRGVALMSDAKYKVYTAGARVQRESPLLVRNDTKRLSKNRGAHRCLGGAASY